ncbi:ceramidase [Cercophora scortea]|uniref:Ceramidase n=1 Tax=Cercophora scortea TaxID=314031 RepID=A0AAE0J2P5_9PEZI|nr:ceramidase [Cercophora scortea]
MIVGFGSMAFHTTLKYEMQLADELPMIYTVCILSYAAFSFNQSPKVQVMVGTIMVGLATFITLYYLYGKDPVFHQVAYGILTLAATFRGFYAMEYELRPALKKRSFATCDHQMNQMWTLAMTGIVQFTFGFFIWNMDNIFCHHLVTTRNHIQLPWAVLLEGHAWWHILTGLAYHLILWRLWLNRSLEGKEKELMLDWKPWSVPQVVPRPGSKAKGKAKGSKAQ